MKNMSFREPRSYQNPLYQEQVSRVNRSKLYLTATITNTLSAKTQQAGCCKLDYLIVEGIIFIFTFQLLQHITYFLALHFNILHEGTV